MRLGRAAPCLLLVLPSPLSPETESAVWEGPAQGSDCAVVLLVMGELAAPASRAWTPEGGLCR